MEPNTPLSPADRKLFNDLRRGITDDLNAAREAGKPFTDKAAVKMATIIERKLWRESYRTFNDFCLSEWGWTEGRGYQLASSVKILPLVENERQGREIQNLPADDAKAVVAVAKATGPLTAARVKSAREMLDEATQGLSGAAKAEKQAEMINAAEAAARAPSQPRERDRKAAILGHLAELEKRLDRATKDAKGEPDIDADAWQAEVAAAIQGGIDRGRQLVKAAG